MEFGLGALARQDDGHWWVLSGNLSWSASPHPSRTTFFAPDFALKDPKPWLVGSRAEKLSNGELSQRLSVGQIELSQFEEPNEEEFLRRHQEILQNISQGVFAKVVPAVFSCGKLQAKFSSMAQRLLTADSTQWPYAFSTGEEGMIGLTPEILFRKAGRSVSTQAVAGTSLRDGADLLSNKKERLEHDLVVEDLSKELWPLGEVEVGCTEEKAAGSLKHLVTPISVKLKQDTPFEELVERLHPSAALGGYPRVEAREWLNGQPEFIERKRFGAPFGWREASGDGVCLVAIRNMQWQKENASIGSGCGVVAGSLGPQEWQELKLKRSAILQALGVSL